MITFIITTKGGPYLKQTIEDLRNHAKHTIEIIVGFDGVPVLNVKADRIEHATASIGQRAMLNRLAKLASYDLIAKVDDHCSFAPNFDDVLLHEFQEHMILAPAVYPLEARTWSINHHNRMAKFGFNTQMAVEHLPGDGESMCMQGSFFMLKKQHWFNWNVCDDSLGSWGHQGTELGIQAFLNNGICFITPNTFYAHLFKHSEADFEYKRDQAAIDKTHQLFIDRYRIKKIKPLIEKYNFPFDWTTENVDCVLK